MAFQLPQMVLTSTSPPSEDRTLLTPTPSAVSWTGALRLTLEGLEYFEVVSELTLVPPIVRTDTANYTCEVESHFVQNHSVISANITVKVFGELLLLLFYNVYLA